MEQTFNNAGPAATGKVEDVYAQEQQRIQANQSGEQKQPGAAGRAQAASLDPKEYDARGGPGSQGNKPVQDPAI